MPQPISAEDDEGSIFLSSLPASGSFTPFFTTSTSQPLLTPVKQTHRVSNRSPLSSKPAIATLAYVVPAADLTTAARVGVGTKRKSTPHITPNKPTPLKINEGSGFDRLAPLPAPKFLARTPQSKAETDAYLKRQTATLTRLRLSDHTAANSHDDANLAGTAYDSGCEMDEDESANALFLHGVSTKSSHLPKSLVLQPPAKGKEKEEVAEAISPGGHVTKRRARTRPLSAELLEQSNKYLQSPSKVCTLFIC